MTKGKAMKKSSTFLLLKLEEYATAKKGGEKAK